MSFKEAIRRTEEDEQQRKDYFANLYGLENVEDLEHIEEEALYPSNRYYTIKLFYDPARFRTLPERRRLLAQARAQHPGRDIELCALNPEALASFSISPHAHMEELFLERGHVTDVEGRTEDLGRRFDLRVVARNIAVLRANGFYWSLMLQEQGRSLGLVRALVKAERDEEILGIMAPILGKRTEIVAPHLDANDIADRPPTIPLVMHEQLMLGTEAPANFAVHIAYESTPKTAIDKGARFEARRLLYADRTRSSSDQLSFELSRAARLFGLAGAAIGAEANTAMSAAILTWFSQVITVQRKICWISRARRSWDVGATQLRAEANLHGPVIGVEQLPRKIGQAKSWQEHIDATMTAARLQIEHATGQSPQGFMHEISLEDRIIAALNGAAIECPDTEDEFAFFEAGLHLVVLGHWIGSLKRTGQQTLDARMARYIRQSWGSIRTGGSCLLGQFPEEVWLALVELAGSFVPPVHGAPGQLPMLNRRGFREPKPITVTYAWVTEQTMQEPRLCRRTRTRLELRGPMLCFPSHQAQYWLEKAQIIRNLRGFLVTPRRNRR
ncbi:hypothetical protein ACVWZK_001757 [Bradyrhizobium sp. GM0.4]